MRLALLLVLAGCTSSPSTPADAGSSDAIAADAYVPHVDAPPADAPMITTACTTTGNGSAGAQCCVWDDRTLSGGPAECGAGLWCGWTSGTQDDATCIAQPAQPTAFYEPCTPGSCYVGGVCMVDPLKGGQPKCLLLCRTADEHSCGGGSVCKVVSDDGAVGVCEEL